MMWWKRYRWWLLAMAAGLCLRLYFVWRHAFLAGDSLLYGDLAANLVRHHTFGFTENVIRPTLIRLPGYPIFLAVCFKIFGINNWPAVMYVQVALDLVSCWLMGEIARRVVGERAGLWVVWLAAICPFTANYTAAPLTECLAVFWAVVGFYGLVRWVGRYVRPTRDDEAFTRGLPEFRSGAVWALVVGVALAGAVLLRPDRALVAVSVVAAMVWVCWRSRERRRWLQVGLVCGVIALPLVVWTARNWRTFHVFQPLAPRNAMDAGEYESKGFERWYRTWAIEFASTDNVYWNYDGAPLDVSVLPTRAMDSAAQRAETEAAIENYNRKPKSTPAADAPFAKLAEERVKAHPFAYYVGLPAARVVNMWLRPRTEMLPAPMEWWRWQQGSGFAAAYAAVNLLYVGLAVVGVWLVGTRALAAAHASRKGRGMDGAPAVVACAMVGFVALRSVMLLTIDNSEPRYTVDCYPVVIVMAGIACAAMGFRRRARG